ncbi:MAG: Slam-dependent surface lipoprotein [Eikenella sp.]|nr:Slam-dependent surface lipoprotein [Eikenella sp.]
MQKRYLPALIALSALALSACGSSGGGGGNNQSFNPGNPGNPGANTPSVNGQLLTVNQNGSPRGTAPVSHTNDINQITIAGRTIELIPQGISVGAFLSINDLNGDKIHRTIGGNLANARWGYLKLPNQTEGYLFAHGKPTEQMPTANGIVKYSGLSLHRGQSPSTAVQGTAKFDVNFANKTLTGTVSPTGVAPINLQATISGNTFAGERNGVQTNGGFYGPNAAEMAGVYRQQGQFSGAFGAKKQ